jgi:hypothetical protein
MMAVVMVPSLNMDAVMVVDHQDIDLLYMVVHHPYLMVVDWKEEIVSLTFED